MADDNLSLEYEGRLAVERLLDAFEQQWRTGPPPDWKAFLPEDPALHTRATAELLKLDREYRRMADEARHEADYLPEGDRRPPKDTALDSTQIDAKGVSARKALPPGHEPQQPQRFGEYELLSEIARGGMGVVYKARQLKLGRIVALKMIRSSGFVDQEQVRRFYAEAEAAAKLEHSGIVPIYEVGDVDGQHFFSMAYIQGQSLNDRVKAAGPLAPKPAAMLMQAVANAVQYAHEIGIIHRDLKPHNILLDEKERPRIADFGLAKELHGASEMTATGQILGTPGYMPPEQAAGKVHEVGIAADVYSLGATLYCVLTGRPPFQASSVTETIRQVLEVQPVSLRRLNPEIPRDLETICLKCLRKEPEKRYGTASELAQDLECWLENKPITARPVGRVEKVVKWVKRKPTQAAALGLAGLSLLLMGLISGTFWLWQQAKFQQDQTEIARRTSEEGFQREKGLRATLDRITYLNRIGLAYREWQDGNLLRTRQLLEACPTDLRGWEWRYVRRLLDTAKTTFTRHATMVRAVDFSPDGQSAVTGDDNGSVFVWNTTTGALTAELQGHKSGVWSAVYSPDGASLATCGSDGSVRLWDAATGTQKWKVAAHTGCVNGIAFSTDGLQLASVAGDVTYGSYHFSGVGGKPTNEAKLWDVEDGREILAIPLAGASPLCVTYSPDGKRLAVGYWNGALSIRDSSSGDQIQDVPANGLSNWVVSYSPDGQTLAVAQESNKAVLWNIADQRLDIKLPHPKPVHGISFSSDGSRVVTACDDSVVRVWDRSGNLLKSFRGHIGNVNRAVFDRSGKLILSCGHDKTARIWDARTDQQGPEIYAHRSWVTGIACPGESDIASVGRDGGLRFWNPKTGVMAFQADTQASAEHATVAASPNGKLIAVGTQDNAVELWDPATHRRVKRLEGHKGCVRTLAFSPNGRLLVSASDDRTARLWDLETDQVRNTFDYNETVGRGAAFSPDSRLLAYGQGSTLVVRDLTSEMQTNLTGHGSRIYSVAFSPDGKRVATGSHDHSIRIWDPWSGRHLLTCLGHSDMVFQVVFSPDGSRLASVGQDATVRIWLAETGEEALAMRCGSIPIYSVAFLHDGERLVSGDWGGSLRVWNASFPEATAVGPDTTAVGPDTAGWMNRGIALYKGGDFDGAEAAFHDVLRRNPDNAYTYDWLAYLKLEGGDPAGALPFAEAAVTLDAEVAQEHLNLGRAREGIGDLQGAVNANEAAARLDPGNAYSAAALLRIERNQESGQSTKRHANWRHLPADSPPPAVAPFDAPQAQTHQRAWAAYLQVPVEYSNHIGMKFRLIPPGEFLMGSSEKEMEAALKLAPPIEPVRASVRGEFPQRTVVITQPFYLGVHEVTQRQFESVMGRNPAYFSGKQARAADPSNFPVESVTWQTAANFCFALSVCEQAAISNAPENGYRLPTSAEWEFATRAGSQTSYWSGDQPEDILRVAWFKGSNQDGVNAVGQLPANPFGLFDVHGNVAEWCLDWHQPSYEGDLSSPPLKDPTGPAASTRERVLRGGAFSHPAVALRSAFRLGAEPSSSGRHLGFRVALPLGGVAEGLKQAAARAKARDARLRQERNNLARRLSGPCALSIKALSRKYVLDSIAESGIPLVQLSPPHSWKGTLAIKKSTSVRELLTDLCGTDFEWDAYEEFVVIGTPESVARFSQLQARLPQTRRTLPEATMRVLGQRTQGEFIETPLRDVCLYLSDLHSLTVKSPLLDDTLAKRPVSLLLKDVTLEILLNVLCTREYLDWTVRKNGKIEITRRGGAPSGLDPTALAQAARVKSRDARLEQVLREGNRLAIELATATMLEFVDTPRNDVLNYLADVYQVPIVALAPSRAAKLAFTIKENMTFDEALTELCAHDLEWDADEELGVVVGTPESIARLIKLNARLPQIRRDSPKATVRELGQKTQAEFVETPLSDICAYLTDLHNITVELPKADGSLAKRPISLNLRGATLEKLLNALCVRENLDWSIQNGGKIEIIPVVP